MRDLKFILSAAAILLTGAIAAGLIAYAVVSPQTGEVQSAGVVTIPTVLGQTAEEVLFYPWSMYDTQPLRHLTDDELLDALGLDSFGNTMEEVNQVLSKADYMDDFGLRFFTNFGLMMPLSIRWDGLVAALECNLDANGNAPAAGPQMFLKDYPALAGQEDQVPVTLSFAASGGSLSFLIRPAQAGTFTEEEQTAALERVENDLLALFSNVAVYTSELADGASGWLSSEDAGIDYASGLALRRIIQTFFDYNARSGAGSVELISDFLVSRSWVTEKGWLAPEDFETASIDEFLSAVESVVDWNIQIVTTQQQILVLFTRPGGAVFGVYYDIQLGCYSGIGINQ